MQLPTLLIHFFSLPVKEKTFQFRYGGIIEIGANYVASGELHTNIVLRLNGAEAT